MSGFSSTEGADRAAAGRRLMLAVLALGLLAACGKKGTLRLPRPGEPGYEPPARSKAGPKAAPLEAEPKGEP